MPQSPPRPHPEWAYFFDVDGTLAELAATPDTAHVAPALRERFAAVRAATGGAVALVSGRALADIDRMFGEPLPAAGQHGAERRMATGQLADAEQPVRDRLAEGRQEIVGALAARPGLLLEDKGYALALHYRAAPHAAGFARALMRRVQQQLGRGFAVQHGKRVVELLPAGVNKGGAIRAFLEEAPFRGRVPVFLGDDITDEAGFAAVDERGGLSIKVGAGATRARYRLAGVQAVSDWLAAMDGVATGDERTGT